MCWLVRNLGLHLDRGRKPSLRPSCVERQCRHRRYHRQPWQLQCLVRGLCKQSFPCLQLVLQHLGILQCQRFRQSHQFRLELQLCGRRLSLLDRSSHRSRGLCPQQKQTQQEFCKSHRSSPHSYRSGKCPLLLQSQMRLLRSLCHTDLSSNCDGYRRLMHMCSHHRTRPWCYHCLWFLRLRHLRNLLVLLLP